jgi:uncharacterized damage-inducible protein DinB
MTKIWTAAAIERAEPDFVADERTSLEQWLDYHRATLLTKCAGLTAEQLKERAIPPSRLSLLGLVRHMVEVERWWFRMYAAQEEIDFPYDPDSTGLDFEEIDDADAAADLIALKEEFEAARAAMAERSLDDVVHATGDRRRRDRDVRWIFVLRVHRRGNPRLRALGDAQPGAGGAVGQTPEIAEPVCARLSGMAAIAGRAWRRR